MARRIEGWRVAWEAFTRPNFDLHGSPIRPERIVADCQAVLPDDAILARRRRPSQLVHAVLGGAPAADDAEYLGLLGHGLRCGRRAWRQARRARPPCVSIVGDGGFTMVPHVLCTAVEYESRWCGGLEQLRWGAIRDIQYGMFGGHEFGTFSIRAPTEALQPRFRSAGRAPPASMRSRSPSRRTSKARSSTPSGGQALPHRRARRRRRPAAGDRRLGVAADAAQGTGLRQSLGAD